MTTPSDYQLVNAFVDGELDLKSQLEMEQRLLDDSALRRQVEEVRECRESLRKNATYHSAPDTARQRMATLMAAPHVPSQAPSYVPPPTRESAIGDLVQRWLGWRPLAASLSFAAVLAVAVNLAWLQSSKDERLAEDVVASHARSTLGQHLVDVASSDHHTVKPFLSSRLGFSPPVDELQIPGSVFLGGRVDYLDGRPVAALVYKQGEHVVNSFVWPSTASDSKPSYSEQRGYQTAHWSHGGMAHWVISDVNREEFQTIVGAVQRTDPGR
jgi:anti-sigma factor RsiW